MPRSIWFIACIAVAALVGCTSSQPKSQIKPIETAKGIDPLALQADVNVFSVAFDFAVAGAASEIMSATKEVEPREAAYRWRSASTAAIRAAARLPDPRLALTAAWAICIRQRVVLNDPKIVAALGEQAPIAHRTAENLEAQIRIVAAKYIPPENLDPVRQALEKRASERAVIGLLSSGHFVAPLPEDMDEDIQKALLLPLSPFGALQGIGSTPDEIHQLGIVATNISGMVQGMPEQVRWEMEYLLLSLENHRAIREFARLVDVADGLPAKLGAETRSILESSEKPMESLQSVMDDVQSVAKSAEVLAGTAEAWEGTVRSVNEVLLTVKSMQPPPSETPAKPAEPGPPPDVILREVSRAGEEWRSTVAEVRGLVSDLQAQTLQKRLDEVNTTARASVDHVTLQMAGLIDRAAWWGVALVVLLGLVLSAYRFATRRLVPRA